MASPRIIGSIVAVAVIAGAIAAFAIVWRPAIAAIDPPAPPSFDRALVKRGRDLAAIGNCNDCHTVRGGKDFAGGLPVPTPFGTIYSSNITPDAETGIGRWSEAAFRRAMRSGVDRDGQHLYPTFPYDHFTNVSDDDDRALYAFLMTRQPVRAPARDNELAFPLDQRFVVAGWKLLFLRRGTYQPDSTQERGMESRRLSGRGAGALRRLPHPAQRARRGTRQASFAGGDVDNWHAYAINASRRRRCRGMPTRCSSICARAGIPITASRAGRWRRWSAICPKCPRAMSAPLRPIWPACSARRRRSASAAAMKCWRRPGRSQRSRPTGGDQRRRADLCRGLRDLP